MCQVVCASIRGGHFSHTSWYEVLRKSPSSKLKHRCVKYLTNEWVFNLGLRGMERHDKVLFFFCCFLFISIISLEYMCRFPRLCLGSPLRSEMEAQNHKKKKKKTSEMLQKPKCSSKGERCQKHSSYCVSGCSAIRPLIGLIENLNARFVFFPPIP